MTKLLTGDILESYLSQTVYPPKQKHDFSFDLTVKSIFQPSPPASIDFGGSEYEPAIIEEFELEKRSPDDEYGWWTIPHGPKLIGFNEQFSINEKTMIIVYPHERLFQVGAFMVPFVVEKPDPKAFFLVGMPNLNIKQNARIAKAIGWEI